MLRFLVNSVFLSAIEERDALLELRLPCTPWVKPSSHTSLLSTLCMANPCSAMTRSTGKGCERRYGDGIKEIKVSTRWEDVEGESEG